MKNNLLYIIVFAFLFLSCVKIKKEEFYFYLPEGNYTGHIGFVKSIGIPDLEGNFIYKGLQLYSLNNDSIKIINDLSDYSYQGPGDLIAIHSEGEVYKIYGSYVMKGRKIGDTYYFGCYYRSSLMKGSWNFLKSEQVGTIILEEK